MIFNENPMIRRIEKLYLAFLGCLLSCAGLWFLMVATAIVLVVLVFFLAIT